MSRIDWTELINQLPEADQKIIEIILERLIIANDPDFVMITPKEKSVIDGAINGTETITLEEVKKGLGL